MVKLEGFPLVLRLKKGVILVPLHSVRPVYSVVLAPEYTEKPEKARIKNVSYQIALHSFLLSAGLFGFKQPAAGLRVVDGQCRRGS